MRLYVEGVGLWAPGMQGWEQGSERLCSLPGSLLQPVEAPRPELLSSREQRRSGNTVRLALEVALQAVTGAGLGSASMASVFATAHGDSDILNYMCQTLARAPEAVSPTRFHNSVHNAAGGYWSIGRGCRKPLNCLSSGRFTVASGLLDAAMQLSAGEPRVLLCAYDVPAPEPLHSGMPIEYFFGAGLVLCGQATAASKARIDLSTVAADSASPIADAPLQQLREDNPAAELLPLLIALAQGKAEDVVLALNPELGLKLEVAPCP
ncbi:beta-ketoacyl synthase chain length factor [Aestuariirhabdus sp. LZHN29]|uniref:beta-ketoacyl synthase chain length factor n=1 Tax=Aestuariirhabdus sp. LZHN29 TaxID=3417462 RepID=UPI003CF35185